MYYINNQGSTDKQSYGQDVHVPWRPLLSELADAQEVIPRREIRIPHQDELIGKGPEHVVRLKLKLTPIEYALVVARLVQEPMEVDHDVPNDHGQVMNDMPRVSSCLHKLHGTIDPRSYHIQYGHK